MRKLIALIAMLFTGCSRPNLEKVGSSGNWNELADDNGNVVGRFPNFRMETNGEVYFYPDSVAALEEFNRTNK